MVRISIILLVKNGQAFLEEVLQAVYSQRIQDEFEVIAIDSGSTDKSKEILTQYPVKLFEIPPITFNHGETRNLGASLSQGEFLVFLTQDATPLNEEWLENLVQPLREDSFVAGSFSSQRPRPDCPLMEKRQILQTELTSGRSRRVNKAVGNPDYERNPYPYIWFSNTGSCIRKEIWEKIPFRRVEFAEDQDWAKRVLEAGYKTVYVPEAILLHSHHYGMVKNFRRHFEHAKAMKELFGKDEFPFLKAIFPATRHSIREDYNFFRSEGERGIKFCRWLFPSLFWYVSAFTGLWLGTHFERIPLKMSKGLSLQPSIIKK